MLWRLLCAVLLAATLASAQRGNKGGDEQNVGEPTMRSRGPSKFDQLADKLKLTSDQKTEVRTIIMDAAKETGPLQQQLMKMRENMAGALIAGSGEQADQVLAQYTPLMAQLAGVEAKSFAKICAMLKPAQQTKAGAAYEVLAAIYEPVTNQGQSRGRRGER